MPGHLNPPEGGGDARRRQQRCSTVQKDGCRILTWSVQTLVLVPAEIRYLQALISVLQPRLSRLGGPEPVKAGYPYANDGGANLADPVCVDRTLGHHEEARGTDGALVAQRMTAAEAAVLLAVAAPAAHRATYLTTQNTRFYRWEAVAERTKRGNLIRSRLKQTLRRLTSITLASMSTLCRVRAC